jgi:hypothetical protein
VPPPPIILVFYPPLFLLGGGVGGGGGGGGHCFQIAENSTRKLKYSGRKKLFMARNWSGTLAEISEK